MPSRAPLHYGRCQFYFHCNSLDPTVSGQFTIFTIYQVVIPGDKSFSTGAGATLTALDQVGAPEPMSLALVGSGLFGLGFVRRRVRPRTGKSASGLASA